MIADIHLTKRIVDVAQEYVLESRSTLPINTTYYYESLNKLVDQI